MNCNIIILTSNCCAGQKSTLDRMIQRSKRSVDPPAVPQKKTKRKKEICQRYPMYVNFTEIGFSDWIQAPGGYDAFYCKGECKFPLANHLNATNHAVMQTLLNSFNSSKVPRVCCVPTKMSTQTLLYKDDDGKLVVKNYQEMTVDECGCRWRRWRWWYRASVIIIQLYTIGVIYYTNLSQASGVAVL